MTENVAKFEEYEEVETIEEQEVHQEPRKKKSALEALLDTSTDIQKTISLERFPEVDFVIKAITGEKLQEIREECTHSRPGQGGKMESHVNEQEVGELLVAEACIEPDFSDPALMDHYEAESPGDCTQKALLAGEVLKLSSEIMELSGFEKDPVEQVKN